MSVLAPSRTTRLFIKLGSLSLAGLLAGLLTGCTSASAPVDLGSHNDTGWQTSQTYASATADMSPARTNRASTHLRNLGATHTASAASNHRHALPAYPSL
jgi:hypothetical protein